MKRKDCETRKFGSWRWLLKGILIIIPLISDASELDAGEADPAEDADSDSQGGRTLSSLIYSAAGSSGVYLLIEWLA